MPPKKETSNGEAVKTLLTGFEDKETKLLAAAFVSSIGPDKYDYELMAALTKNTAGSLKKMWPPVKKKVMEAHPSFAAFLGTTGATMTTAPAAAKPAKAAGGLKRKAATPADGDVETEAGADSELKPDVETEEEPKAKKARTRSKSVKSDGNKSDSAAESKAEVKKKGPAKGRGRPKKAKQEGSEEKVKDEADGDGDGMNTEEEV